MIATIIWFFIAMFVVLLAGAAIATLLRLVVLILPLLAVTALVVVLAANLVANPVPVLALFVAGGVLLKVLRRFKARAALRQPRATPIVFWWLPHDQGPLRTVDGRQGIAGR
jgi:hypothetical protein